MGRSLAEAISASGECRTVAGVDVNPSFTDAVCSFPVYQSIYDFPGNADIIIDFSHHSALPTLVKYATERSIPLVIATTGHTDDEIQLMKEASKTIPVFFSRNMSIGINLLIELCKVASNTLGLDFDVEIVEKHHNKKLDAPSGTAMMLAEALKAERDCDTEFVYSRQEVRRQREKSEIGIHSVRGGTIVGEHDVIFAGNNEIITLSHSATSREIFATGALKAALFIVNKPAGFYSMSELIAESI